MRAFHPIRLLEFVLPFPFGEPGEFGPKEYWQFEALPTIPYFYTLYFGIVGLWLAFKSRLVQRPVEVVGMALACFGRHQLGLGLEGYGQVSSRDSRLVCSDIPRNSCSGSPWLCLYWQGSDSTGSSKPPDRLESCHPGFLVAALLVLVVILFFLGPAIVESAAGGAVALATDSDASRLSRTVEGLEAHLEMWLLGLATGGALLVLTGFAVRRQSGAALIALQLVGLLQLYPLMQSMPLDELTKPSPWMDVLVSRGALVHNAYFTDHALAGASSL